MRYSRLTVDGSCSYRIKPPFSTSLHVGPGKFGVLRRQGHQRAQPWRGFIAATTRSATVSALASFRRMKRAGLAATIKARWICEQAHQQLKEKLGLDHFEGRSWQGLHRHALMTMIAYAFLQHRPLTQVGRKKESTDRRLSLACRPYATPSSISFFDHYLSNAHTAEDEAVKNSGVGKSAKVGLVSAEHNFNSMRRQATKEEGAAVLRSMIADWGSVAEPI